MKNIYVNADGKFTRLSFEMITEMNGFEKVRLKSEIADIKTQLKYDFNPDGTGLDYHDTEQLQAKLVLLKHLLKFKA